MKNAKKPQASLKVLYVTPAGRTPVSVVPENNTVKIGDATYKLTRDHLWPGKGQWDAVIVEGQPEALSPWRDSPITPEEYDSAAHNNLLEQVHALAKGVKTSAGAAMPWITNGLIVLGFVLLTVKLGGDISELRDLVNQLHSFNPPSGDSTVVQPNGSGGQP